MQILIQWVLVPTTKSYLLLSTAINQLPWQKESGTIAVKKAAPICFYSTYFVPQSNIINPFQSLWLRLQSQSLCWRKYWPLVSSLLQWTLSRSEAWSAIELKLLSCSMKNKHMFRLNQFEDPYEYELGFYLWKNFFKRPITEEIMRGSSFSNIDCKIWKLFQLSQHLLYKVLDRDGFKSIVKQMQPREFQMGSLFLFIWAGTCRLSYNIQRALLNVVRPILACLTKHEPFHFCWLGTVSSSQLCQELKNDNKGPTKNKWLDKDLIDAQNLSMSPL